MVYPSVFSLKMFLGNNPKLNLSETDIKSKTILDIGFGDGRDLVLFHNLGLTTYGIEVDEEIVAHTSSKFNDMGLDVNVSVGYNDNTGFTTNTFDYVYSVAALMYLRNEATTISDVLKHVYSITKHGGYFMGTFTRSNSFITKGASTIDENRIILKDPFYKFREGQIYHLHHSKLEVERDLSDAGFINCLVCNYDIDWFGTRETAFMFVARK